jgi:hypothetical protein
VEEEADEVLVRDDAVLSFHDGLPRDGFFPGWSYMTDFTFEKNDQRA